MLELEAYLPALLPVLHKAHNPLLSINSDSIFGIVITLNKTRDHTGRWLSYLQYCARLAPTDPGRGAAGAGT